VKLRSAIVIILIVATSILPVAASDTQGYRYRITLIPFDVGNISNTFVRVQAVEGSVLVLAYDSNRFNVAKFVVKGSELAKAWSTSLNGTPSDLGYPPTQMCVLNNTIWIYYEINGNIYLVGLDFGSGSAVYKDSPNLSASALISTVCFMGEPGAVYISGSTYYLVRKTSSGFKSSVLLLSINPPRPAGALSNGTHLLVHDSGTVYVFDSNLSLAAKFNLYGRVLDYADGYWILEYRIGGVTYTALYGRNLNEVVRVPGFAFAARYVNGTLIYVMTEAYSRNLLVGINDTAIYPPKLLMIPDTVYGSIALGTSYSVYLVVADEYGKTYLARIEIEPAATTPIPVVPGELLARTLPLILAVAVAVGLVLAFRASVHVVIVEARRFVKRKQNT